MITSPTQNLWMCMYGSQSDVLAFMGIRDSADAAASAAIASLLRTPPGSPAAGAGFGLSANQALGVRGYLAQLLLVGALGGRSAGGPTPGARESPWGGPPLSAGAGGLLVARNVSAWLYGACTLIP